MSSRAPGARDDIATPAPGGLRSSHARAAGLLLLAAVLSACGFGGGGGRIDRRDAVDPATQPTPTTPAPQQPTAPTSTAVSAPDAIGRLAASFTADLLVRQQKQVGLGPLACRDLAGSAGCIQLLSGGGACSSRFKAGVIKDRPDEFLATCIAGDNSWHCDVDLQYFVTGDKAGQAAFHDSCPAPDTRVGRPARGDAEGRRSVGGRAAPGDEPDPDVHRELNRSRAGIVSGNIGASRIPSPGSRAPPRPSSRPRGRPRRAPRRARRRSAAPRAERDHPRAAHPGARLAQRPASSGARCTPGSSPPASSTTRSMPPSSRRQPLDAPRRLARRRRHESSTTRMPGRPGDLAEAVRQDRVRHVGHGHDRALPPPPSAGSPSNCTFRPGR